MTYIPLAHGFSCVRYRGSLLCSSDLVRICLNISLPSFSSSLPLAIILLADNFTSKLNFACVELLFFYGTHTHNLLTSVFWSLNLLHFSWWESPLNPMSVFLWCGHFILWIPLNIIAEYNIRICSTLSQEAAFSMEFTVFFRKEKKKKAQNQKWYVKAKAWGELVNVGLWGKAWRFHVLLVNEDTHVFISVFLKSWARIKPWLPIWHHGIHSHFLSSSVTSALCSSSDAGLFVKPSKWPTSHHGCHSPPHLLTAQAGGSNLSRNCPTQTPFSCQLDPDILWKASYRGTFHLAQAYKSGHGAIPLQGRTTYPHTGSEFLHCLTPVFPSPLKLGLSLIKGPLSIFLHPDATLFKSGSS